MPDVTLPRLSDAMEQGTVVRWLKADGDAVQPGDELAEIDTGAGTATATFEADAGGVLTRVAREGETVRLGGLLATVGVDNAAPSLAPAPPTPPAEPATKKGDVRIVELTRPQQVLARRVAEAKAIVPELTVTAEADVTDALARLTGDATADDLVVRAAALALRDTPHANGAYRDGQLELYSRVNVGVAVAAPGTLAVPTIFDADRKPLEEIAAERRALADRVHAGTIKAPELSGATFTVASAGAATFQPVITTGQAAILGAGAIRELPRVAGGALVARHVVHLTLVADHRILHGADAAAFLAKVRALLEEPGGL